MSERMTDERIKQLSDWAEIMPHDNPARPVFMEILRALKAERLALESREAARAQYLEEKLALEAQLETNAAVQADLITHIRDIESQLEAVRGLSEKWRAEDEHLNGIQGRQSDCADELDAAARRLEVPQLTGV